MKNEKKDTISAVDRLELNIWRVLNNIMDTRINALMPGGKIPYVISFIMRDRSEMSPIDEMGIINRLAHTDIISIVEGPKTFNVQEEWETEGQERPGGINYLIKLDDKFDEAYEYYEKRFNIEESDYKLTIHQESGNVTYTTPNDIYTVTFRKNDTALKLLLIFARYPHKTQSPLSICRELDGMIQGKTSKNEDDERRIRDAIRHIRKRLGLTENKTDDKLFMVDNKNFGIGCDVEIK